VSDAHTRIDAAFGPGRVPLPFDEDHGRKPACWATRDALLGRLALPEPGGRVRVASVAAALGASARPRARRRR
jgi:hypothetical protein